MSDQLANLVIDLQCPQSATRRAAAEKLTRLGAAAIPAAEMLVLACADADEQTREWATAAVEELPAPHADVVPRLGGLLRHENGDVAFWAATLLGRIGPMAAAVVEMLTETLAAHPHLPVRQRAAWALGKIGAAARTAVPQLQLASASTDAKLARIANQSLAAIMS